jgi:hypothetical protein
MLAAFNSEIPHKQTNKQAACMEAQEIISRIEDEHNQARLHTERA